MLRGNLATRPFYNQRLVTLMLLLVAVAVAALTMFNVREFMALSAKRSELNARITRDRTEADRIAADTARLRQEVDLVGLRRLAADTAEANALIDERTFSWTSKLVSTRPSARFGVRLASRRTLPPSFLMAGVSCISPIRFRCRQSYIGCAWDRSIPLRPPACQPPGPPCDTLNPAICCSPTAGPCQRGRSIPGG